MANVLNESDLSTEGTLEAHRIPSRRIFEKCTIDKPGASEFVKSLRSMRCPIFTTNYDTLLEQVHDGINSNRLETHSHTTFMSIEEEYNNWPGLLSDSNRIVSEESFKRLSDGKVIHIHGIYTDSGDENGFTLTAEEYANDRTTSEFLRFLLPIARVKSLVFILANGTTKDAHFLHLWLSLSGSTVPHYVLLRNKSPEIDEQEMNEIKKLNAFFRVTIYCYFYGRDHGDIIDFMNNVNERESV
eukprot:CAMPEP_0196767742 /NCGR_PEP_ID=MMETSP1095-20130614/41913_1 /TAXON_ID=96789 ORGANISM="Chromulina nebulosa, Strain UTEXLB2642" /NCGR_SAMPLE_ID=MMETSP1095 /ASSEMBLY_ACC=CAM_ASM_000446 /LENGTH=242 /DNA_ID=CAMNT_0042136347 /DNA_START=1697 /DNA_END=2425 /DNA_ORIENTATION=+